jgi:Protein of unknown function (DUF 659)/hAT family C-terminal dimerisation region
LARAVYATGTPLSFTENPYWIAAFKKIRPSLKLPSRHQLSNTLLQKEFHKVEDNVKLKIAAADTLGIQCDGWSNLRNESIVNVLITTPEPVVFKSIDTKAERHTGQYMADLMGEVMEANGVSRFLGAVTDNARNMKSAWEILSKKYPDSPAAFYGCAAHILNLLIGDIMKTTSLFKIQTTCKKIVKDIKGSHKLGSLFKSTQVEKKIPGMPTLKLPVSTRWASIVHCLNSLVINKAALKALAISEHSHLLDPSVQAAILDSNIFWVRVESVLVLLEPIKKWIAILESDLPRIAMVPQAFKEIKQHFEAKLPTTPGTVAEEQKILEAVNARKDFALHAVHMAANILHPEYMGIDLSSDEDVQGVAHLYKVAKSMSSINAGEVMADLAEYRSKGGLWANSFVWTAIGEKLVSPICWWKGICGRKALSKVAVAILSLPATSAATERSFSTYGIVHTAKRNRLTTKRAGMLVYVKHNLKIQEEQKNPSTSTRARHSSVLETDDAVAVSISSDSEDLETSSDDETASDVEV